MINTINNKNKEKKEKAIQAIARAKEWADRRRRKAIDSTRTSSSSLVQTAERKYEVNKVVEDEGRIALLKSMLKKDKRLLAETKLRIEMIERELQSK